MKFPSADQGHRAHQRGQDDALAGADRDTAPWSAKSTDSVERCLALAYQRGYGYGLQIALDRDFGNAPTR